MLGWASLKTRKCIWSNYVFLCGCLLACLLNIFFLFLSPAQATQSISVAYCVDVPPFHYKDDAGQPAGMMVDFWKLWSEKTGVAVKFIPGEWDETIALVREGKVDAHAGLFYSKERDSFLDYGVPLAKTDTHIFYHESLPQLVAGPELLPYRVGVIEGDLVQEYLKKNVSGIFIAPYKDYGSMMADLRSGRLKTFAADTPTALHYLHKFDLARDFQFHASRPLYQSDWFVAVPEGDKKTLDLVNKGMGSLSQRERVGIVREWTAFGGRRAPDTIVIAMDRNYPPVGFMGKGGKPEGLFVDIWKLWAKKTRTKIDFRPSGWTGTIDAIKTGEADIHLGLFRSAERDKWLDFPVPIYQAQTGLYFKDGNTPVPLSEMKGRRVGTIEGTFQEDFLKREYPEVPRVTFNGIDEQIVALLKGQIYAGVNETLAVDAVLDSLGLQGALVRHPDILFSEPIYPGIAKGRPELLKKIRDGIAQLSDGDFVEMEKRWIPNPENRIFSTTALEHGIDLTPEERAWLRGHPTLRISNEMDWPPYDFVQDGEPAGYSVDYWKLVASKLGIKLEWVNGYSWSELVQMTKDKKLDVIHCITRTKERERFFNFPRPYHTSATMIFTRPEDSSIGSIDDLAGRKVATIKGFTQQKFLAENYPHIKQVEVDNALEGLIAVSTGKADGYIDRQTVCQYYIKENNIPNVVFASLTGIPSLDVKRMSVGVRNDWPELADILDKGIASVSQDEIDELKKKWFGKVEKEGIGLTAKEKNWLREHPRISVAVMEAWPPMNFADNQGKAGGIGADYLQLLGNRLGVEFEAIPGTFKDNMQAVRDKRIDALMDITQKPEREPYYNFTKPYLVIPHVIVARSDSPFIGSEEALNGKTLALEQSFYSVKHFRDKYPDVKVVEYPDTAACLEAVSTGMADAYAGNRAVATFIMARDVLPNLKVHGKLSRKGSVLNIGVRKDWPELATALDKALDSLSFLDKKTIVERWVGSGRASKEQVRLSPQEKAWIKQHPTLKVAATPDWPPFEYEEDGRYLGVSADFLRLAADRVGLKLVYHFDSWGTLIEQMKRKELDLAPGLVQTPERDEFLKFTKPFVDSNDVVMVLKSRKDIQSIDDLNGKTVAVEKGFYNEEFLRTNYPDVKLITVPSTIDALKVVVSGRADAYIGMQAVVSYLTEKHFITDLKVAAYVEGHDIKLRVGVRDDYGMLRDILQKAYATITPQERNGIVEKYFRVEKKPDTPSVKLTAEEREWLLAHPVVRVAATPDWPPFEFDDGGKHKGIAADILRLAAERVGLKLDIQFKPWGDVLKGLKEKTLDVCPGIVKNEKREGYINFTDVIFISQIAVWVKTSTEDIAGFEDLEGRTVAVEKGYASHDLLAKNYPGIKLLLLTSPIDCIRAVSSGKADAYLGNQASTSYLMNQNVITDLKPVAYYDEGLLNIRMGVRKDWPLLVGILNKGLKTVSQKEKSDLLASYTASTPAKQKVVLTEDERKWISEHKNIRLGVDPAWPPFEYFLGVTYSGLSSEYVKQLSKDTGLTFAPPPIFNWSQVLQMAGDEKLDVLPGVSRTPDRDEGLAFSKPYAKFPLVIYQRTDSTPIKGMAELDNKRVAVVDGYAIGELLQDNHSDIIVQTYMNLDQALMALSKGAVDALAGNMVAVEFAKQNRSIFNVAPTIKTPYIQELRFGVRKDWGTLVRIIDKWLATVDSAAHDRMMREAGVSTDTHEVAEGVVESVDFKDLLLLGAGIILVFGISLILLLFLRRYVSSRAETLYSSHQYKIVGIIVGILFLCLVVVATWFALSQVEKRARYTVGEVLESVLLTTHESLAIWDRQNKKAIDELVTDPVLRALTRSLLALPEDKATLEASPPLWNLRKFMRKSQETWKFVEFSIVSKNYLNYATSDDSDLLDKNEASIQRPRVLDKVFLGSTIFIPPIRVESDHDGEHGTGELSLISIAAPIKGADGKILAALILNYDASEDYQRIIALGRIGETGETYAFDKNGSLSSESRFDELLRELGLVGEGQRGILNLRIADPGGNLLEGHELNTDVMLPLTESAKSASARKSGLNLQGYRDYRGVPVFGAWLWDEDLGLGIATEIDVEEALGSYRLVRNTVIVILFITILLGTLMTGLSNWIGQSAAKSLQKAKDELEDRVEERTAELKKITVAVEQSPATVVITDPKGTIQYVNPTFTEMTGYTWDEAIGQNPRVLKSGQHSPEFYKELWDTILQGNVWQGDFLNRRKSGELFWERASIAPIFNDENELTNFVAVKEDITERKAQEERFQALLDAAPDAMVIVGHGGDIGLVNIATEELFGYSREEMIGQKVEMLLPEYVREKHPGYRDKFFARPGDVSLVANKDFMGQNSAGDVIPVDISLSPIETADGIQIIASIRDITERKKAEEAIAASEERTRLILSSAGEGIFGVDLKGEVTFINDAACEMVGYRADELMGKPVHDIIHHSRSDGSFYPVEECPMRHAFVEGLSSRVDDEVLWRKDGTSFPVEYSAVPMNRGAEMIGAVISFQDITDRKEAEDALRKSEERFRGYFEHSQVGMAFTHPDKGWLDVNERQQNILGYTMDELKELSWLDLTHPEDTEEDTAQFERMAAGEIDNYTLDKRFIRKDGEVVHTNLSVSCIREDDGQLALVFASMLDITERKKMEQEIIESKAIAEDALAVVTSSIQYASRIQRSVLPPDWRLQENVLEHFVVWEPRDVVGGDLFWCEPWGEGCVIILGDCTGHGVPGAFMTLLSTGALENALIGIPEGDSAGLVAKMHRLIQRQLGQNEDTNGEMASDDGLELGVCYIPPDWNTITFAGARMPLFIDHDGEITQVKPDKKGIAYRGIPYDFEYTNKEIDVKDDMTFIMTTDGMLDQVGGDKGRGYGKKRFIALLESLRDTPLQGQGKKIYAELLAYQGKEKRRDDVSIIGFKL